VQLFLFNLSPDARLIVALRVWFVTWRTAGGSVYSQRASACVRPCERGSGRACLRRWWIAAHRRSLSKLSFDRRYLASLDARRWCPVILRTAFALHISRRMNLEWLGIRLRFRWHSPPPFLAIPPARIIEWRTSAARLPRNARVHARTYSRVRNPTYPTGKVNRAFVTRMKERSLLWDRVSSLCASDATEFYCNLRLGIGKYISNTPYRFSAILHFSLSRRDQFLLLLYIISYFILWNYQFCEILFQVVQGLRVTISPQCKENR